MAKSILNMIKGGGTFKQTRNQARRPAAYDDYQARQAAAAEARRIAEEEERKRKLREQQQAAAAPAPAPAPVYTPPPAPAPAPAPSPYDSAINNLNMQISNLTTGMQSTISNLQKTITEDRAQAARNLEEMRGQMAQQIAAGGSRQTVQGIRTPDRGTGGSDAAQLQRKGLRGTFGRAGDRLMKISSLNV